MPVILILRIMIAAGAVVAAEKFIRKALNAKISDDGSTKPDSDSPSGERKSGTRVHRKRNLKNEKRASGERDDSAGNDRGSEPDPVASAGETSGSIGEDDAKHESHTESSGNNDGDNVPAEHGGQ